MADEVKLLALSIDERAIILGQLEDPPDGLTELRAVLLNEHQWRQREGLDSWRGDWLGRSVQLKDGGGF